MKKLWLAFVLQALICSTRAQKTDSANRLQKISVASTGESRIYNGFTIKLASNDAQVYHFDILTDGKSATHHFQNPLPFSPKGIQKKEDAYKIAQWIINAYKKTGHWENMVPPHVARQLGID